MDAGGLSEAQKSVIRHALTFSLLSYAPLDDVRIKLGFTPGYTNVRTFDRRCMQGIGFVHGGFAFLAFRGSHSLGDWVYNFACLPFFRPLRHIGFEAGWRVLRPAILRWIEECKLQDTPLVLTGHSLGGTMAQLAAFDLARQGRKISNVVTFGAPKAVLFNTADAYDTTSANMAGETLGALTYCIVNKRDLIPRLPPSFLGFRSLGRGILIDHQGRLQVGVKIESTLFDMVSDILEVATPPPATPFPGIVPWQPPQVAKAAQRETNGIAEMGRKILEAYLNVARTFPPLLLPVIYVRFFATFGQAGANHLSAQYVRIFFGDERPAIHCEAEKSRWDMLFQIVKLLAMLAILAGFIWTCWVTFKSLNK